MNDIYNRIREVRTNKGMSQQELAELAGYKSGKSMIAKIEKGLVDLPLDKVSMIASALNVSPAYLMGWEDEEEAAYVAADLVDDPVMVKYVSKLMKLDDKSKAQIYSLIDLLLTK